ncbi:MAG: DUF169 domain-containing protein [Coriobacteriia bacterium]|nr:DUF169 domain-containing protein [Coriobacteriia bacterium]
MTSVRHVPGVSEAAAALTAALGIAHAPVGVRVLRSRAEFDEFDAPMPRTAVSYCGFVKLATRGRRVKIAAEHFRCSAAAHALGVTPSPDPAERARDYVAAGLYADEQTAAAALEDSAALPPGTFGVAVGPLDTFPDASPPDVAIFVADPYTAMRMMQGYSFHHPEGGTARMRGMHAMCSESTAATLLTGSLTMTLLCSGARHMTQWEDDELVVGVPGAHIIDLADGVLRTVVSCETDERKADIESGSAHPLVGVGNDLGYGRAYFLEKWTAPAVTKREGEATDDDD